MSITVLIVPYISHARLIVYGNLRIGGQLESFRQLNENIAIRGGWGVTEKLPSYYVLYPRQEYRDIQTFGVSYNNNESAYVYYSQPYTLLHNEKLRWQKNQNAEIGVDINVARTRISLVGYFNRTKMPYKYTSTYTPFGFMAQ